MSLQINQPFPVFFDIDGSPLDNGYVYIGPANTNPETTATTVYWDDALTLPATQPLRTINGHIARNGAPASVFSNLDSYAVTSRNSDRALVVYSPSVASASMAAVAAAAASAAAAAASAVDAAASAADAAATSASIITQAELEDYLGKMRVPIGAIIAHASGTVSYGYLECNGAAVSRTSYAELFAEVGITYGPGDGVSTFNVPDIRAKFLRGWDHGRGIDAGRVLGSSQDDQNKAHTHTVRMNSDVNGVIPWSNSKAVSTSNGSLPGYPGTSHIDSSGGAEARPSNVAVMYIIKAYDAPLQTTPPSSVVTDATTARTLALVDQSKYIRYTNAAPVAVTVPTNAAVPFPIGSEVHSFQAGAGVVTFVAGVGVTINAVGLSISAQDKAATLKKVATDTWDLFGGLS